MNVCTPVVGLRRIEQCNAIGHIDPEPGYANFDSSNLDTEDGGASVRGIRLRMDAPAPDDRRRLFGHIYGTMSFARPGVLQRKH